MQLTNCQQLKTPILEKIHRLGVITIKSDDI
jgi:hypothetical protein